MAEQVAAADAEGPARCTALRAPRTNLHRPGRWLW